MEKTYNKIIVIGFAIFLSAFFVLNIAIADKEFSQNENRFLASFPEFSWEELFNGEFTADFETYFTDQFVFRDSFVELKATCESLLAKKESNGIYKTSHDMLLERFEVADTERAELNINAVETFAQNATVPVYLSLIPTSTYIYKENLPMFAPNDDQLEWYNYFDSKLETANMVNTFDALYDNRDQYIYYRTDHHWTSLGAYYGYFGVISQMGLVPIEIKDYTEKVVSDDFNGTYFSTSGVRDITPDSLSTYIPQDNIEMLTLDTGTAEVGMLYDDSFLDEKDKYSYYLGGNQALNIIKSQNDGGKLLLIRDSYSNCQVPFLAQNFSEIHMVDLRYMKQNMHDYIEENDIDTVLIQYNMANFVEDVNVSLLGIS